MFSTFPSDLSQSSSNTSPQTPTSSSFKPFSAFRRASSRATFASASSAASTLTDASSTTSSVKKPARPPSPRSLFVSSELAGWGLSAPKTPKPLIKLEKKEKKNTKASDGDQVKRRKEMEVAWEKELKGGNGREGAMSPLTSISSILSSTSTVSSHASQTLLDSTTGTRSSSLRAGSCEEDDEEAGRSRKRDTIIALPLRPSSSTERAAVTSSSAQVPAAHPLVIPAPPSSPLRSKDDTDAHGPQEKPKKTGKPRRASVSAAVFTSIFGSSSKSSAPPVKDSGSTHAHVPSNELEDRQTRLQSPPKPPAVTRSNSLLAHRAAKTQKQFTLEPLSETSSPGGIDGVPFHSYVTPGKRPIGGDSSRPQTSPGASNHKRESKQPLPHPPFPTIPSSRLVSSPTRHRRLSFTSPPTPPSTPTRSNQRHFQESDAEWSEREGPGWSGAWNRGDMQVVISQLRNLK